MEKTEILVHEFRGDDVTDWERAVLVRSGLPGWRVQRIENEGYCWTDLHIIQCTHSRALFLHEVAHALRHLEGDEGNDKHDGRWGDLFTKLVGAELDAAQPRLAQLTAPGEYDELLKRARMILQPPEEVIEIDEDGAVHAPSIRAELATAIEQLQAQLAHWKHCHGVTADALEQAEARLAECKEDAERLHKALTELVELKDLKDRDVVFDGDAYQDYARRKPRAWAAARAAIDTARRKEGA